MMQFYEADGVAFTVNVTGAPVLGFAEALARRSADASQILSAQVTISGVELDVEFGAWALAAGTWHVQVRAGVDQASAQTVWTGNCKVTDSIAEEP